MDLDAVLPITVSGIRPGEASSVIGLIQRCGLPVDDLNSEKLHHFLAARKGGQIVGVVGLEIVGDAALLRSLCVDAEFRKSGTASRLITAIERYANDRNIQSLFLLTQTAEAFFRKCGYRQIERNTVPEGICQTNEFKQLCPDTAVCLTKRVQIG